MTGPDPHVAVVGAGAAGLYTALRAARLGARVTLVSATPLAGASSYWAQGGLAAALAPEDSTEAHLRDTLHAGRGAVRPSAAQVLVDEAPAAVADLSALGVHFDTAPDGELALGLEGGHSARRIVHAGGAATGRRLIRQLSALAAEEPLITVIEGRRVARVLTDGTADPAPADPARATGLLLDDGTALRATAVVLATGGAAAMWSRTTNPPGATGSGLLLAHDAGATLADIELMQFHPTAVIGAGDADGFLVTEAVRGEGAHLLNAAGERFVDELLPRDEVARAVQQQIDAAGGTPVGLDMRHVDPALFPNVVGALRRAGIDPETELIPIAPAAHYMMGGVAVDLRGRSSTVAGLYAVGECSCTGLHGANPPGLQFAERVLRVRGPGRRRRGLRVIPGSRRPDRPEPPDRPLPDQSLSAASRAALWADAGLERDGERLSRLLADPSPLVRLIARAALARQESRGAHLRLDFPALDPALDGRHVTLTRDHDPLTTRWQ